MRLTGGKYSGMFKCMLVNFTMTGFKDMNTF